MSLVATIRFRPFSHLPGCRWMLPGTSLVYEVYPSCTYIFDIDRPEEKEKIVFDHEGPLDQFCVLQDLEKGKIIFSGFTKKGFIRREFSGTVLPDRERLFLGPDKSQDWQQVARRKNVREIVPFLYWLAQSVALPAGECSGQIEPSLVHALKAAKRDEVELHLKNLYMAAFGSHLVPRVVDSDQNGYLVPIYPGSSLHLLKEIFCIIRSLFIQEEGSSISILPRLPPAFVSGTLANIRTKNGHTISLEWTKGLIRRVLIKAAQDDELSLSFQKQIASFRLEKHRMQPPATLKLTQNKSYLLDNFEK